MSTALSIKELSFSYMRKEQVLADVTLSVGLGKIVGLIGPNGSGKSTLIRLIADLLKPQAGSIDITGYASSTREAKQNSLYVASNDLLPEFLTGSEYLRFMHAMYGLGCDDSKIEEAYEKYQMSGRHSALIEDYSHGMRKKLQLIAAIMVSRPLTLIDETPNGIDIEANYIFQDDVLSLAATGGGVLLCSHDFALLESVADSVILLHRGVLAEHVPLANLINEYGSIDAYTKKALGR